MSVRSAVPSREGSAPTSSEDGASTPDVSVVIPAYNAERFLTAAIDSALNQTGCTVEVIVVDDESLDSTPDVMNSFGHRIHGVRTLNGGPGSARNAGVRIARGEWIAFLDADDLWEPDKLAEQLKVAQKQNCSVVYTNARNFGENLPVDEIRLQPDECHSGDVFEEMLVDNFVTLSSLMVRRSVFNAIEGFDSDMATCEDWDLLLRLAATEDFGAVTDPKTAYRWGQATFSKQHEAMHNGRKLTLRRGLSTERGRRVPALTRRRIWSNMWNTSAWFASANSPLRALRWYCRSVAEWPFQLDAWKGLVKMVLAVSVAPRS